MSWRRLASTRRLDVFTHSIETTHALGGIVMLNHPNFHYAADAKLLTQLAGRGLTLVEVANEAVDSNNQGDQRHPSTEALWDLVLSSGATIYATATDDAHHYYDADVARRRGQLAHTGDRGWVMVRADRNPQAIKAALRRGDFYASTGVTLASVSVVDAVLTVRVDESCPGEHQFRFVTNNGRVLFQHRARQASVALPAQGQYLRVVVSDAAGHRAWTQPVRRPG